MINSTRVVKKVKKIELVICALVLWCATLSGLEAAMLQVNPPKILLSIPAGESGSGKITVRNPSEEPIVVNIYAQDWQYSDVHDGTKVFFPAGTLPLSCAKWISLSQSELNIPANGQQDIYYTVKMPEETTGGHYAVLFFESMMSKPVPGTASLGFIVRLGVIFHVESAGMSLRAAELGTLTIKKQSSQSLAIDLDIKNTGNTDMMAKGTFHFIDKKGTVFARSSFNPVYTFPNESAKLHALWKEKLPKGIYDVIFTIDIGKVKLEEEDWNADYIITKETEVHIGSSGEVVKAGELR